MSIVFIRFAKLNYGRITVILFSLSTNYQSLLVAHKTVLVGFDLLLVFIRFHNLSNIDQRSIGYYLMLSLQNPNSRLVH